MLDKIYCFTDSHLATEVIQVENLVVRVPRFTRLMYPKRMNVHCVA